MKENVINVSINGKNLVINLDYHYHLVRLYDIEDIGDIINEIDSRWYYILLDKSKCGMDYVDMHYYYKSESSIIVDDITLGEYITRDEIYQLKFINEDMTCFIWGVDPELIRQLDPDKKSHVFLIKLNDEDDINENFIEKCIYE